MYNMPMNMPLTEECDSLKGGLVFSLCVAVYVVLNLIVSLVLSLCGAGGSDAAKYLAYLVSPVAVAVTLAVCLKYGKMKARQIFPVKCSPKYYFIGLLMIFGLLFCVSYVNYGVLELMKLCGYTPKKTQDMLPAYDGALIVPVLLVIAVLPAVAEELLFRGAVGFNTEASVGTVGTVFLVGFVFALFHGSAEQTLYQFICGCAFALLALRARSVVPSVVIHFINNALIVILQALDLLDGQGNLVMPQSAMITVTVLAGVCFLAAVALLAFDKKPTVAKKEGSVRNFFLAASVGIVIMAVLWITSLFPL